MRGEGEFCRRRWEAAYESQKGATGPEDLATALEHSPGARRSFERLGKTDRYLVILGLLKARTPQTRAARLRAALAKLETDDRTSHRSP